MARQSPAVMTGCRHSTGCATGARTLPCSCLPSTCSSSMVRICARSHLKSARRRWRACCAGPGRRRKTGAEPRRGAAMANDEHVAMLKQGVDAWNGWRDENPDIRPDLNEADLSGANLNRANLKGANLKGANLKEARLNLA